MLNWIQKRSDNDSTAPNAQQEPQCPCTSEKQTFEYYIEKSSQILLREAKKQLLTWSLDQKYNQTGHALEIQKCQYLSQWRTTDTRIWVILTKYSSNSATLRPSCPSIKLSGQPQRFAMRFNRNIFHGILRHLLHSKNIFELCNLQNNRK